MSEGGKPASNGNGDLAESNKNSHSDIVKQNGDNISSNSSPFITIPPSATAETLNNGESEPVQESETRLWIGNLDPRLREYHLLKMVQRYGTIDNFDFLFHRTGPNTGLPRGYAFVTFQDKETAEKCLKSLDGTKVLDKHVAVRWANQATITYLDEETKMKSKLLTPAAKKEEPLEATSSSTVSKEKAISAIEAKLKAMEREKESGDSIGSSSNFFYKYNKEAPAPTIKQRPRPYDRSRNNRRPHRR